jgi:hypothetical protein
METHESKGPTAGRQFRGARHLREEQDPEVAMNRDLPENLRVEERGFKERHEGTGAERRTASRE